MTPAEHRALGRAAVVLLVSGLVRWGWEARRGPPVAPPDRPDAREELLAEATAIQAEEERRARPFAEGERLDPNRASEIELDRLPGVGPATARAIVEARDAGGGFRTVEDLLAARGIGEATLARMRPLLEIRAPPVDVRLRPPGPGGREGVDINRADEDRLTTLPGIGPALAARIVEERRARGGFAAVDELLEVAGIGPATLERIRDRVRVR